MGCNHTIYLDVRQIKEQSKEKGQWSIFHPTQSTVRYSRDQQREDGQDHLWVIQDNVLHDMMIWFSKLVTATRVLLFRLATFYIYPLAFWFLKGFPVLTLDLFLSSLLQVTFKNAHPFGNIQLIDILTRRRLVIQLKLNSCQDTGSGFVTIFRLESTTLHTITSVSWALKDGVQNT